MESDYRRVEDGLIKLDEKVDRMQVDFVDRMGRKADREEVQKIRTDIVSMKGILDGKVSYKALIFVAGLVIGVLGYIVQRLDRTSDDVSFIRGKFAQVESVSIENK